MHVALSLFIKLYGFTTGRRIVTLRKIRKAAVVLGARPIIVRIDEALDHDCMTRELDLVWMAHRNGRYAFKELQSCDDLVDTSLTGVRDGALSLTKGARPGDPIADKANYLLAEIFPAGVAAVTSLPCVDELAAVEVIVGKLQGELAPLVKELGLALQVKRVVDLVPEYRRIIETRPHEVDFAEVRKAREQGQTYLVEIVAMSLGTYCKSHDPDHVAARAALLEPVLEQQEAIRLHRQGRRTNVVDIDPDTGVPDTDLPDTDLPDTEFTAAAE